MMSSEQLAGRARRGYELARLRRGLLRAVWVLPFVAASLWLRDQPRAALALGGMLAALVVVFEWRGGSLARAVAPGLLAGVAPLLLPFAVMAATGEHACAECGLGEAGYRQCLIACVTGGLLGGGLVGWRAARLAEGRLGFVAAAAVVAGLAGAMGCAMLGQAGVLGMLLGFLAGGAPVVAFAARAR